MQSCNSTCREVGTPAQVGLARVVFINITARSHSFWAGHAGIDFKEGPTPTGYRPRVLPHPPHAKHLQSSLVECMRDLLLHIMKLLACEAECKACTAHVPHTTCFRAPILSRHQETVGQLGIQRHMHMSLRSPTCERTCCALINCSMPMFPTPHTSERPFNPCTPPEQTSVACMCCHALQSRPAALMWVQRSVLRPHTNLKFGQVVARPRDPVSSEPAGRPSSLPPAGFKIRTSLSGLVLRQSCAGRAVTPMRAQVIAQASMAGASRDCIAWQGSGT